MKGLSSLERIVLDSINKNQLTYNEVLNQSGLHENVCFNILQAMVIRGILATDGVRYRVSENLSPLVNEELNGLEARQAECLELIEAVVDQKTPRIFRFQKIAMDERDEKIFNAMLTNLEMFLVDAHKKAHASVPIKSRKVVFWGVGEVQSLMKQIVQGGAV